MIFKMNVKYITVIIISTILLCSCGINYGLNENATKQGIPSISIDHLFLSRTLLKNDVEKVGTKILNNYIYLTSSLEPIKYENYIPWGKNIGLSPKTYNLYMQSLYDVQYLNLCYKYTNNIEYIRKAKDIINSWMEYEKSDSSKDNKLVWYDHAVAMRSLTMMYFLLLKNDNNIAVYDNETIKQINEYLLKQGEWLYADEHYGKGNHGLMMDRALLQLGIFFNNLEKSQEWREKALKRIYKRAETDFTEEGVHLENSISYHVMVMNYYSEIGDFMDYYNLNNEETTQNLRKQIKKMQEYLIYAVKPDGMLPSIGDSSSGKISGDYDNEDLQYVVSKGKQGVAPNETIKYYPQAGIAYFRDSWQNETCSDAVWGSIKSGFSNTIHKHDDDLSFTLYALGNDIFVDGGKYNYEGSDPFRKYVLSSLAHNSVSVDNKTYYATEANMKKIEGLKEVTKTKDYVWFRCTNSAYRGVKIERNFIYFPPNSLVIIDNITSSQEHKYLQHFLLGPNMKLTNSNKAGLTAVSEDNKVTVQLKQFAELDRCNSYRSDDKSGKGYISETFNNKIPINYLEYEVNGQNAAYVTGIDLIGQQYKQTIDKISFNRSNKSVDVFINSEGKVKQYNLELNE